MQFTEEHGLAIHKGAIRDDAIGYSYIMGGIHHAFHLLCLCTVEHVIIWIVQPVAFQQ